MHAVLPRLLVDSEGARVCSDEVNGRGTPPVLDEEVISIAHTLQGCNCLGVTHVPGSPYTLWSTKLDVGGIIVLLCHGCPIWDKCPQNVITAQLMAK